MAFTSEDERKLAELLAKKREAEREKRNAKKKLDNLCIKEFGCKASEIVRTRELVKELMALYGKGPEDLAAYVEWTKGEVNRTKHDA